MLLCRKHDQSQAHICASWTSSPASQHWLEVFHCCHHHHALTHCLHQFVVAVARACDMHRCSNEPFMKTFLSALFSSFFSWQTLSHQASEIFFPFFHSKSLIATYFCCIPKSIWCPLLQAHCGTLVFCQPRLPLIIPLTVEGCPLAWSQGSCPLLSSRSASLIPCQIHLAYHAWCNDNPY